MEKIITDNAVERVTVKWDGERFAITQLICGTPPLLRVVILNPREMMDVIIFAGNLKES